MSPPPLPDVPAPSVGDRLFIALQQVLPQHAATAGIHWLARVESAPVRAALVKGFLSLYPQVDLSEAAAPDPGSYRSFNDFFTRALRPGARPVEAAGDALVSPVDGTISQAGPIEQGRLLQAKGHWYSAASLLGSEARAAAYDGGTFATIYLAPYNYHRIHMPLAGRLKSALHVPGALYSVNRTTAENVPGLFARNERVVCEFDTATGPLAQVLVGALFVGSMALTWCGDVTPSRPRRLAPTPLPLPALPLDFAKGEEMGRFNMGSTVILLLPRGAAQWRTDLVPGRTVRMGERLATLAPRG